MTDIAKASALLQRGVLLDSEKRYSDALVFYQEGLQLLLNSMKCMSDPDRKKEVQQKVQEFLSRAENLKQHIKKMNEDEKYHEQIQIKANSTGNSYEKVFGRFFNGDVEEIEVEDAFIRKPGQRQNFLRFCELATKRCPNLKKIVLTTSRDKDSNIAKEKDQDSFLEGIKNSLLSYNILLIIQYNPDLHDRQIILSNGWLIKIGRGLDYFKPPENKFSLGFYDMDLRSCMETTVDIFHKSVVKSK